MTKIGCAVLVMLLAAVVPCSGGWVEEDEYGKNYEPGSREYQKDICSACEVAFKFINAELEKPYDGASGEMRAAVILDSKPCQWAVGPTMSKCYKVIEELDEDIEEYIIEGTVKPEKVTALCHVYCSDQEL
eukprot:TRINITY_DN1114_c0_g1_i3.p1 TRINITY_DN1114_c0_g1~~TRINITY_DN1114_c0_g1_i3.p1  ORF type:complete len:140 (+),score=43.28 TRINITY_DN1114_c0_g1_i3:28-420(+)